MDKDGKIEHFNFLPRYVRWYVYIQRHIIHIYGIASIFVIIAAIATFVNVKQYMQYEEVQANFQSIQANPDYIKNHNDYELLQQKRQHILQKQSAFDTQHVVITLLDGAMSNQGSVRIENINFTDEGFTLDGMAGSDEEYFSYMQYIQAHLQGWICNGKQDIQKDRGYCLFHVDGHKKESNATDSTDSNT